MEAVETRLDLPRDARAREAVILAGVHRVERLRRDLRTVVSADDPVPDRRLAATAAVRVRGVEHRDAEPSRGVHDPEGFFLALAAAEQLRGGADAAEVAAAQDEARDLEAGQDRTLFHGAILSQARFARCC